MLCSLKLDSFDCQDIPICVYAMRFSALRTALQVFAENIAISPDGTRLFTADMLERTGPITRRYPRIYIWDLAAGRQLLTLQTHLWEDTSMAFPIEDLKLKDGKLQILNPILNPIREQLEYDGNPVKE
jgi:hypothetical protein